MSVLSKRYFHDEAAAFEHLEAVVWPEGPTCPHCGSVAVPYDLRKTRIGLRKCRDCRKQFTVRVGTIFESSHVELHKWLQAVHLMTASKKGISAHQLHRILEVTYKTAWFMAHRIREAMKEDVKSSGPLGGEGPNRDDRLQIRAPDRRISGQRHLRLDSVREEGLTNVDGDSKRPCDQHDRADANLPHLLAHHVWAFLPSRSSDREGFSDG